MVGSIPRTMAFGELGHTVIARLADPYLSQEAREALETWLPGETLPEIAVWADDMRGSNAGSDFWGYDHSASWHFVNIDPGKDYVSSEAAPEGDIVQAIEVFSGILRDQPPESGPVYEGLLQYRREFPDRPDPLTDKALALRFLVHFVADIHQPLHAGYGVDRGGNDIEVEWFGRTTNLHAVWDTQLVRSLAPGEESLFLKLEQDLSGVPEGEFDRAADSTVHDWVQEALRLREYIYDSAEPGAYLASRYATAFANTERDQMLKAAIRTATTLNRIFASSDQGGN